MSEQKKTKQTQMLFNAGDRESGIIVTVAVNPNKANEANE